jgi:hypothetical protein
VFGPSRFFWLPVTIPTAASTSRLVMVAKSSRIFLPHRRSQSNRMARTQTGRWMKLSAPPEKLCR